MKKATQINLLSVLLVACLVGGGSYLYFTGQGTAPATTGTMTPTGGVTGVTTPAATGVPNLYCDGADKTVTLSVTNIANGSAVSTADTRWEISSDGVTWSYKETDSNSATPSVSVGPYGYVRAMVLDDSTYYGVMTEAYYVNCISRTEQVRLKALDSTPSISLKRDSDGQIYAAGTNDTLIANGILHPTVRLYTDSDMYYNKPALCFDYDTGNFSYQKVQGAAQAAVPYFLKGTVEECYEVPSFNQQPIDVILELKGGATQFLTTSAAISTTVYLVDTQVFTNNAGVFSEGFNLADSPYTNVGDNTDASSAGTLYFQGYGT